jgi:hypothetical protein
MAPEHSQEKLLAEVIRVLPHAHARRKVAGAIIHVSWVPNDHESEEPADPGRPVPPHGSGP